MVDLNHVGESQPAVSPMSAASTQVTAHNSGTIAKPPEQVPSDLVTDMKVYLRQRIVAKASVENCAEFSER